MKQLYQHDKSVEAEKQRQNDQTGSSIKRTPPTCEATSDNKQHVKGAAQPYTYQSNQS